MRYFIKLSYNGKLYHGWQNQPNAVTVQQTLEIGLSTLLKQTISVIGAGRTDAGVHASVMFAHFDTVTVINSQDLVYKLNSFLPKDISVYSIFKVKDDAHARFDAISRTYLYRISTFKDVFNYNFSYHYKLDLDIDMMNEACNILYLYEDFKCFSKTNTDVKTFNCNIINANWEKVNNEVQFTIQANRFLRNMVRAIVGTMILIGNKKIQVNDLHNIIRSKSRSNAGYSVPAHGLYLKNIEYPDYIKNR